MAKMRAKRKKALEALGIDSNHKVILSLDGGGIRGILTLQLLKKIEEIAGIPCCEIFDMVAGTSTGGIIAGLIASSKSAFEIEALYIKLVTKVFKKRSILANRFTNSPLYNKINYRKALKTNLDNITLKQACEKSNLDLLITSKDIAAGEETFFTCFKNNDDEYTGTYKDTLLRSVMEATMSAPTYFTPLERFVDGGTTTYNNPTLSAIMEAVNYGPPDKYSLDKLCVFSLGTGTTVEFIKANETTNPKGVDAIFWLNLVMREASQDASDMQNHLIRSGLIPKLDFRRFQISLDTTAISKLPNKDISNLDNVEADWLWELTNDELKGIELDDVSKFPLMRVIGEAMVDFVMENNKFSKDLINKKNKDLLVTSFGDVLKIQSQMSNPKWIDGFKS